MKKIIFLKNHYVYKRDHFLNFNYFQKCVIKLVQNINSRLQQTKSQTHTQHQYQPMQAIQIKPANHLSFKIPYGLTTKFSVGNFILRPVCIYIISLHPHIISVDTKYKIVDAFGDTEIAAMLHWSQDMNCLFKSKIRVYVWELYDEQSINNVLNKMFNKENEGNCLLFEQLTIDVEIDTNYLQKIHAVPPLAYSITRVNLPNEGSVSVTEQMLHKVINHCEKVAKVKAIYTFGHQYVVQFSHMEDIVGSFCEVRDNDDNLAIFSIGCLPNLGNIVYSPNFIILTYAETDSPKVIIKKQKRSSPVKQPFAKKVQIESQQTNNAQNLRILQVQQTQKNVPTAKIFEVEQNQQDTAIKHKNKNKQLIKQSFMVPEKKTGNVRKRTKSQELIKENDEEQNESTSVDIDILNQWRATHDFEMKKVQQFEEKSIDVSKKILNIALSNDEKYIYLLLRDCVMICQVQDITNKKIIKFEEIDSENTHLPTPMIVFNNQKMLIFANQSYLFWVSLTGEEQPDWKYVQRKQIYAIEVVQELNLLMVGGKNFSKLSYLGKSTSRSNIKVYSCGKHGKRDHLFTYDIPECNGENVMEMKYVSTKPNGTKLLLTLTSHNKLYFLRVRAYNLIQVYSCVETNQIGIQEIVSINYHVCSSILVCLQKLSEEHYCFKYIKVSCAYEKVQIATQSVKLPVVKYSPLFRMGGKPGEEWITAINSQNCIYSLYLQWKQPQKTQYKKPIKDCLLVKKGAIFREGTQIMSRILKE